MPSYDSKQRRRLSMQETWVCWYDEPSSYPRPHPLFRVIIESDTSLLFLGCNQCYGWKKQISRARLQAKKAGRK